MESSTESTSSAGGPVSDLETLPLSSLGFEDIALLVLRCMGAVLVMTGTGAYLRRQRRQAREGKAAAEQTTGEAARPLVQETAPAPPKPKSDEDGDDKKLLAFVSQQVAIPALLFTRIILSSASRQSRMASSSESLGDGESDGVSSSVMEWTVLLWPLYVVACGLLVGSLAHALSGSSFGHRPLMLASCAFANSTGLPLVLLGVLLQPTSSNGDESAHSTGTYFLSLYLLAYPVLQWSVGAWLLQHQRQPDCNGCAAKETTVKKPWALSSARAHHYAKCKSSEITTDDSGLADEGEEDLEIRGVTDPESSPPLQGWSFYKTFCAIPWKCGASCLSPPVVGALLGIAVASMPALRRLLVADVVTETPFSYQTATHSTASVKNPPLSWMFDALCRVGQAAVPMNMMVLGMNLSSTFASAMRSSSASNKDASALPRRTIVAVILGKMVAMPLVGIGSVALLRWFVFADSIPLDFATPLYLVLAVVFITPTANNCMVMVELSGTASKEGMATIIGWEYTVAPIVLSINVALAMAVAT